MVELKPDASVTEADLRDYCKGVMANYKVPKRFVFVKSNEWIITLTGKFDKKALRERTMKEWGIEEGDRANLI
jgi:fatty-acyl-CoA synthase